MAAPVYGSTGTYLAGNANTANLDVPDNVAVNDIVVVSLYIENTDNVTTIPSGFAEATNSPSPTGLPGTTRLHVFWKRATGADSTASTYDFGWTNSAYRVGTVSRYTGATTTGDPWDVTASSATSSAATGPPAVTLTTTGVDRLLVYIATSFNSTAWTQPSGFTKRVDQGSNDVMVCDLAQTSAGSSGSLQGTSVSTTHNAWAGALIPVSATADTRPFLVSDRGTAADATAGTTTSLTLTSPTSIAVDNYLIARVAVDNSGSSGAAPGCTVTDPRSNTWTVLGPALADPGAAAAGTTAYLCYARVITAYQAADALTFNWGGVSTTAKAIVVEEWSQIHRTNPVAVSAATNNSGSAGSTTAVSVSVTPTMPGQLVYTCLATEGIAGDTVGSDSDTTNGTWTTITTTASANATATNNQRVSGQYKVVTAGGAQSWDSTITSRDWAAIAVVFAPTPSLPPIPYIRRQLPLLVR